MAISPFQRVFEALSTNKYAVIPVIAFNKSTFIKQWSRFSEELPERTQLYSWAEIPNINIGVVLGKSSNIVALDFDYNTEDYHAKIRQLIPNSPVKKMGSKGFTAFYRYNGEISHTWKKNKQVVLELQSNGRMTVLPPSVHPSGDIYKWITTLNLENTQPKDLPLLPEDFISKMNDLFGVTHQPSEPHSDIEVAFDPADIPEALKFIDPGYYDTWVRVGMALKTSLNERGFALWDTWSKSSDKYKAWEQRKKWDSFNSTGVTISSLFYEAIREGYVPPLKPTLVTIKEGGNLTKKILNEPTSSSTKQLPVNLLEAPGLVGKIASWINETAIYPQPILALAAAISAAGVVYGHKLQSETGLRSNQLVLGIAPSGAGKDHARKCLINLFKASGYTDKLIGSPESGAGLLSSLYTAGGVALSQIDEFGYVLKSINHKNVAAHKMSIPGNIMELYTTSDSMFIGRELANRDGKTPRQDIDQPCLCVHATTTPASFYQALTGGDMVDGFLTRWLVFESFDYSLGKVRAKNRSDVPDMLVEELKTWQRISTINKDEGNIGFIDPLILPYTDEAREIIDNYDFSLRLKMRDNRDGYNELTSRLAAHAIKLALVAHTGDKIDAEVIRWAIAVVEHCGAYLQAGIEQYSATNETESNLKKVLRIIKLHNDWMSLSDLYIKTKYLKPNERREILNGLADTGEIEIRELLGEGAKKKALEVRAL